MHLVHRGLLLLFYFFYNSARIVSHETGEKIMWEEKNNRAGKEEIPNANSAASLNIQQTTNCNTLTTLGFPPPFTSKCCLWKIMLIQRGGFSFKSTFNKSFWSWRWISRQQTSRLANTHWLLLPAAQQTGFTCRRVHKVFIQETICGRLFMLHTSLTVWAFNYFSH